ncbi:MAG: hypothetical protein CVU74_08355 [Deltaproteobacteria bacterium HGW-Deltaproteobacteria-9]|nr:MAG: hypothetical protein CVU74_08355 [Deltaproteobacteria bacterium HGW-Deltaproteobacteria-9]
MFLEIVVTVMTVAFLLFALFLIPSLLQLRRTAETIAVTLQALNENLPGILRNLEQITANINRMTFTVNRQVEDLSDSFRKLHKTVIFLADLGQIAQEGIRIPFLNTVTSLAAVVKGVRVFLSVLYENHEQPGRSPKK